MRSDLAEKGFGSEKGFRWRGQEVTRIEAFSDAVFAFAVTLLVVSLEVPATFRELLDVMRGFGGFAVCFLLLLLLWYDHYIYFRRYGLIDLATIWANSFLLFLVLLYVYPLKFLFSNLIGSLLMNLGWLGNTEGGRFAEKLHALTSESDAVTLLVIYGAGFLAVSLVFALLYARAWRMRGALELNAVETHMTVESIHGHLINASIAVISIVIALCDRPQLAGLSYFLIGPARGVHGTILGKQRRALEASAGEAP